MTCPLLILNPSSLFVCARKWILGPISVFSRYGVHVWAQFVFHLFQTQGGRDQGNQQNQQLIQSCLMYVEKAFMAKMEALG